MKEEEHTIGGSPEYENSQNEYSDDEDYEDEDNEEEENGEKVTIGEFFGIEYYLKYYKIASSPALEHFMNQTYDKGYDSSLYSKKENDFIKQIINLITHSDPEPIENMINDEAKKKTKQNHRTYLKLGLLQYLK